MRSRAETGRYERTQAPSRDKLAAELASEIEADLLRRGWPVGEAVGTIAELIERYGASRAVTREAVGLLEHKGIVAMHHGPGGGARVRAPVADAVINAMTTYFDFAGVTDLELANLRHVLLELAARLAAERIDESGVARLREALDREATCAQGEAALPAQQLLDIYMEFMNMLVVLSQSPALQLLWPAMIHRVVGALEDAAISEEALAAVPAEHEEIAMAVMSGDGGRAESLMAAHLRRHYGRVIVPIERSATGGARVREAVEAALNELGMSGLPVEESEKDKLPARVAREIRKLVFEEHLRPGDVIGMETDLRERFGVSRNVFREAVRIVEFHGLAEMRRGPRGGLTVREAEPDRIEDTIIIYLEFMNIGLDDLLELRTAVEMACLGWAMEGKGRRLEQLSEVLGRGADGGSTPPRFAFHEVLTELSGNRAASLIANVLSKLMDRRIELLVPNRSFVGPTGRSPTAAAHESHVAIAEAMLAGDEVLALHRMRRHLEEVENFLTWLGRKQKHSRQAVDPNA